MIAAELALAACLEGPETCPLDPPFEAGVGVAPLLTSHGAAQPLSCAYFDRCGEIVCTATGDTTWSCARDDASPGNCADASEE